MSKSDIRSMTLSKALISIFFLILILGVSVIYLEQDVHIPLILAGVVSAIVGMTAGYTWNEMQEGIMSTLKATMIAVLILMIIGTLIGTWLLGGIVPSMVYYGLKLIAPSIFLAVACIICAISALSTGSSWSTVGTVGIALLGIGTGLGFNPAVTAGAIVSGAYFGDKLSPLSDTTNLAPSVAGTDLFTHIRNMLYTTIPAILIAIALYLILGFSASGNADQGIINELLTGIQSGFTISPLLLIPPLLVIAMVVFKIPAIPGLLAGTAIGAICAIIFQGADIATIMDVANYGFEASTGIEAVDSLLSGGGMQEMMWTVSLIICAVSLGGILESTGQLNVIVESVLNVAKGTGSLILVTVLTCLFCNITTGDQYLAIVLPGRMYKDAYAKRGLAPEALSRVLEDSGTVTSALIPWNTCGATMSGFLGVNPFAYAPYAFFNLLSPIITVICGYTGWTIKKLDSTTEK